MGPKDSEVSADTEQNNGAEEDGIVSIACATYSSCEHSTQKTEVFTFLRCLQIGRLLQTAAHLMTH
jgi:hypothetical protein